MSRHELTDQEWDLLGPLIPRAVTGRPRSVDRRIIGGMVYRIRTGIAWRDLPERYGPGNRSTPASADTRWRACSPTPSSRSRPRPTRLAISTGWSRSTPPSSAPTSTPPPPAEKGEPPAGQTGRSRPRPIPRRPDQQNPPRLRRPRQTPGHPPHRWPTPRRRLCATLAGTHPCAPRQSWPATLQA